ncbi:MAG TPA: hypothetical protein VMZ33_03430 [Candidatus Limnocylindrales bacterium]|nr:hypothetical protein [Candidatus Limnocylindrales bacterium]
MTELEIHAYAGDCLVDAHLELPDGVRLTDYLNESTEVPLTQVRMTALDDGRIVEAENLLVSTDEIHAVEAKDRGGQPGRRIRTRSSEVNVVVGPYRVQGYLHGPTAGDPLGALSRRQAMVPMTSAKIGFLVAGELRVKDCAALIVNRLHANIEKPEGDAPSILDQIGLLPVDPNAKDLTGELLIRRPPSDE